MATLVSRFDTSKNKLPIPVLALNLQSAAASPEDNAELARVADAQMIGPKGARTDSYAKLLAVLAEADGDGTGSKSSSTPAAVESKAAKS